MQKTLKTLVAVMGAAGLAVSAGAQTKWDLPTAYPANNLHTENIAQFVKDVFYDVVAGGARIDLRSVLFAFDSDVITEDVYDVLTLEGSVAARNHIGGTAPAQVRLQVQRWEKIFAEREAQAKASK